MNVTSSTNRFWLFIFVIAFFSLIGTPSNAQTGRKPGRDSGGDRQASIGTIEIIDSTLTDQALGGLVVVKTSGSHPNNAGREEITVSAKPITSSPVTLTWSSSGGTISIWTAATGGTQIVQVGSNPNNKFVTLPVNLWVQGEGHSNSMRDITLTATNDAGHSSHVFFTVMWVNIPALATSGSWGSTGTALNYATTIFGNALPGLLLTNKMTIPVEFSATFYPANLLYPHVYGPNENNADTRLHLSRDVKLKYYTGESTQVTGEGFVMSFTHLLPANDTSEVGWRTDIASSNQSKIYDIDAPGPKVSGFTHVARFRADFAEFACVTIRGVPTVCSPPLMYHADFSGLETAPSDTWSVTLGAGYTAVPGDNDLSEGWRPLTWNLQ